MQAFGSHRTAGPSQGVLRANIGMTFPEVIAASTFQIALPRCIR